MDVLLIEFAAEMLSFSSSYHLVDITVTWTGEEIQKVSWQTKKVIDELMLSTSSFVLKVLFSHLSLLENRTEKELLYT
ncbi:hypothetical protein BS11774_09940 [Bacillus subtilis]|nr:hypothetical protein KHRBS_17630 [Bacillus subtilis subsp. subtilis]KMN93508.1 hypothetical protein VL08_16865 [Bacillus subtilis]MBG8574156.1 hypothetical protein [Bacillus subtilis]MBG9457193.1 hypothetical protein [Bacillus subtilis]MBG9487514.1 hypothetical protein [Bacillus subtilis]